MIQQFTTNRRELGLLLEIVIKETFKNSIDVKELINNPPEYLKKLFVVKGLQYSSIAVQDAVKIAKDFRKEYGRK